MILLASCCQSNNVDWSGVEIQSFLQIASNKRYAGATGFTVSETAEKVKAELGNIDILIHSLANGPEVQKPLLETSRKVRLR